ncbi:hypothetical protein L1987_78358 [Smallanthus sonchifolius]|uniref:Uncharacterized protein n=1 Tax=Smallanthus sonchifolius TaxID=185202 RepID=A0ACB8ZBH6_9ASTR|nr:hypothetical protein L1987_78358 [Smallanthus sonchifolius]
MGPKVSNAPGNIQDFWKPTSASNYPASNEANRYSDPSINRQPSNPLSAGLPAYHARELGPWCAVISYEACVRFV